MRDIMLVSMQTLAGKNHEYENFGFPFSKASVFYHVGRVSRSMVSANQR